MKNPVSKAHRMAEFIEVTPPFSSALNRASSDFALESTTK
jgi:hypothetical protein